MSISEILGTAVSGLAAAQAGLRTVSNNVSNVNTPGYARERLNLSTGVVSGRVSGVVVGETTRIADRFLEATVYRRAGEYGRADVTASYLDRLQALLGEPGAPTGLPARLDAIAASATAMTGSQAPQQTVAVFTSDVADAIASMQQLDDDVSTLRGDVESEVGFTVERINSLLGRIHQLNGEVSRLTGLGRSASGPSDQRMTAIEELGGLVGITVRDQPDGSVLIETASGATLLDRKLRQLSYAMPGMGISQPSYPPIEVRFADSEALTGERLESAAAGGKLGGLLDLRDRALPEFSDKLGTLFTGLAETLNAVANEGTTAPPPNKLEGRQTGLVGADRLGFAGAATFAVTDSNGALVASTRIDFDAMPGATVDDAVAAIQAGLGGAATVSFADGVLRLAASAAGNGVAVAQDASAPSDRGGVGFAHYFGLNDMVRSDASTLVPTGFTAADPHGFGASETVEIALRDASGKALTRYTLTPAPGGTIGDLVAELGASPLGGFGDFSLDDRGRIRFDAHTALSGASLTIPSDSTDRFGTGRSFTQLAGLTGAASGLGEARVRAEVLADPTKLPLARLDTAAAVGAKAVGPGDTRGATAFVERLAATVDLGKEGVQSLERFSTGMLGRTGLQASQAESARIDAAARRNDAINRRDSFSGVNIDEELAQMVVLQNSYAAAARVLSTASEMYDTLVDMV